jgi:hypothetical protein
VSSTIGKAFTPANSLKSAHFHSITGRLACGPIFPSHKTADQSEITATVFHTKVYFRARFLSFAIAKQGAETHGEYTVARSCFELMGVLSFVSIFH